MPNELEQLRKERDDLLVYLAAEFYADEMLDEDTLHDAAYFQGAAQQYLGVDTAAYHRTFLGHVLRGRDLVREQEAGLTKTQEGVE